MVYILVQLQESWGSFGGGEKVCLVGANCQRVVKWAVGTMSKVESEPHTLNISFHLSVSTTFLNKSFDFIFCVPLLVVYIRQQSTIYPSIMLMWYFFFFFFFSYEKVLLIKVMVKFIVDLCERIE